MSIQISKTLKPCLRIWLGKILTFKRFNSRGKCASHNDPICSEESLKKQEPCASKLRRIEANEAPPKIVSMWENPECCKDPCPEFLPRFDELYYHSSDKLKRNYQQSWVSCPDPIFEPKKVCFDENFTLPPMEKRETRNRPLTACPVGGPKICMDKRSRKCPRAMMPGCRSSRQPPKCKSERSISDCLKACTPYPSYSESMQNANPVPPTECECLDHPMMCEVWAEMRRRMTFVKSS